MGESITIQTARSGREAATLSRKIAHHTIETKYSVDNAPQEWDQIELKNEGIQPQMRCISSHMREATVEKMAVQTKR
jgi:hypothetical protein